MTEETEIRIPYDDLVRVSFDCKKCGAETLIDIPREEHLPVEVKQPEKKCPVCGTAFDSRLHDSFERLFTWRQLVAESGHKVHFRLKRG